MATKDRPVNTPPTTTMKFTDARAHLSEIFNQVAKEETRILVEKNGVPVGAIISARDLQRFEAIEAEAHARAYAAFVAFGEAFKDVPDDEFEREVDNAISKVRAEMRAEQVLAARGLSGEEYEREYPRELERAQADYQAETDRAEQPNPELKHRADRAKYPDGH